MIKKTITNVWKKFLMNFSVSVSINFMDLSSNLAYTGNGLNGIKSAKMCQQLVFLHTKKMSCGKVLYLFFKL